MADWWCQRCELAYDDDETIEVKDSFAGEFWGSKCEHVMTIHHCRECLDELDEYAGQDKTGEDDDDTDLQL